MKLAVRLLNLLALLASVAWWGKQGGWESVITSLGLLAAFIYQDVNVGDKAPTHDEQLYRKFLADFPSNGSSARFFKEHDIGVRFRSDRLNEFDRFMDTWQNAEHEFKNEYIGSHVMTQRFLHRLGR